MRLPTSHSARNWIALRSVSLPSEPVALPSAHTAIASAPSRHPCQSLPGEKT